MPKLYRPEKIAIATSVASGARFETLACIDRPIAAIAMLPEDGQHRQMAFAAGGRYSAAGSRPAA